MKILLLCFLLVQIQSSTGSQKSTKSSKKTLEGKGAVAERKTGVLNYLRSLYSKKDDLSKIFSIETPKIQYKYNSTEDPNPLSLSYVMIDDIIIGSKEFSDYIYMFYLVCDNITTYRSYQEGAFFYFNRFLKVVGSSSAISIPIKEYRARFQCNFFEFVKVLQSKLKVISQNNHTEDLFVDFINDYKIGLFLCEKSHLSLVNTIFKGPVKKDSMPMQGTPFIVIDKKGTKLDLDWEKNIYLYIFSSFYVYQEESHKPHSAINDSSSRA